MKQFATILAASLLLVSCGSEQKNDASSQQLEKLKKERAQLDQKIRDIESKLSANAPRKATPVSVLEMQTAHFESYVEVQSQIVGDENVLATSQAPGVITQVLVHAGQKVAKGQVLAILDAASIEQQVKATDVQLTLLKSLYEKQKNLYAQEIGSEVQLLQAKTQYESTLKQKEALQAQRNMYRIVSPISGTIDNVPVKVGDMVNPGMVGIRVVSFENLKAEANLGENYLGKVHTGDKVNLVFPDIHDSINTKLSYVARQVDPISRAFLVQVRLGNQKNFYPNMSCKMKISNYENPKALVVPVQVIQNTAQGEMVYVVDGNKAKSVYIETGKNSNGLVEVLKGLNPGDRVIIEGFEDVDNGEPVSVM